jgi:hypothetical protein
VVVAVVVKVVVEVQEDPEVEEESQGVLQVQEQAEEHQAIKPQNREKMGINLEEIKAVEAVVVEAIVVVL